MGADDHELVVDEQRRHSRDAEFVGGDLVTVHFVCERIAAPERVGALYPHLAAQCAQGVMVAHQLTLAEVRTKESFAHQRVQVLGGGQRDEAVGVKGVRGPGPLQRPGHAEGQRVGFQSLIQGVGPFEWYGVLLGEEFGEREVVVDRRLGIQFECPVADDDFVVVVELRERASQLTGPQVAKWTDHVAPNIDIERLIHGPIVPQTEFADRGTAQRG